MGLSWDLLSPVGPGKLGARGKKRDKAGKRFKDGTRERYLEQLAWTALTQNPVAAVSYTILVLTPPRNGTRPLFWDKDRPPLSGT